MGVGRTFSREEGNSGFFRDSEKDVFQGKSSENSVYPLKLRKQPFLLKML